MFFSYNLTLNLTQKLKLYKYNIYIKNLEIKQRPAPSINIKFMNLSTILFLLNAKEKI